MPCERPSDHVFETETSYEKLTETQNAVVEKKREQKVCTNCGKTPNEIDELMDEVETESNSATESTSSDDAVFLEDNSESQSAPTDREQSSTVTNRDDAMILDSNDGETLDSETGSAPDSLDPQWNDPGGSVLSCPECDFTRSQADASQYPGDSCPNCRKAYLQSE